jgi:hypothetical protein
MVINGVSGPLFASQSVTQNEGRDTMFSEPFCQTVAFMPETKNSMSTTRRDDDGGSGGFVRSRKERRD